MLRMISRCLVWLGECWWYLYRTLRECRIIFISLGKCRWYLCGTLHECCIISISLVELPKVANISAHCHLWWWHCQSEAIHCVCVVVFTGCYSNRLFKKMNFESLEECFLSALLVQTHWATEPEHGHWVWAAEKLAAVITWVLTKNLLSTLNKLFFTSYTTNMNSTQGFCNGNRFICCCR